MADFRVDQAAGLRRLFGGGQLQVVTFASGCAGVGSSTAIANLGVTLARQGKEVMIIDEHAARHDVAAQFGLMTRADLLQVIERERRLSEVLLQPLPGLHLLSAARAIKKLGRLSLSQQQSLLDAVAGLERPLDVILIDAALGHPCGFSPFGLASQEVVIVLSGSSASITEAYALIKKVSQLFAKRHFRILVNKVRSHADGLSIYENIAQVTEQRGYAHLEFAGALPLDETQRQAEQLCRPIVLHAPESNLARACRQMAGELPYWQRGEQDVGGVEQFLQQLLHLTQRIRPISARA